MGVTIGYHRLLAHRSFTCPKFVEYFWVLAGFLALEGSPIWWAAIHRAHHRHVDTELDPHSPRAGLKYAFFGWMNEDTYPSHIKPHEQCRDLNQDAIYRFLEQGGHWKRAHALNFALNIGLRLVLWVCFGWQVALASALAAGMVLQVPIALQGALEREARAEGVSVDQLVIAKLAAQLSDLVATRPMTPGMIALMSGGLEFWRWARAGTITTMPFLALHAQDCNSMNWIFPGW